MVFKVHASLNCFSCGYVKNFEVEAEIYATELNNAKELRVWGEDSIKVDTLRFEGICPDCKYNKAAWLN